MISTEQVANGEIKMVKLGLRQTKSAENYFITIPLTIVKALKWEKGDELLDQNYHSTCHEIFEKDKIIIEKTLEDYQFLAPVWYGYFLCYYQQAPYNYHKEPDQSKWATIKQLNYKKSVYLVINKKTKTIIPLCSFKCVQHWARNENHSIVPPLFKKDIYTPFIQLVKVIKTVMDFYKNNDYIVFELSNKSVTGQFAFVLDNLRDLTR